MRKVFIKLGVFITLIIFISMWGMGQNMYLEKKRLMKTDREFSRISVKEGSIKAFYLFIADNGIILPQKGHPVGKDVYKKLLSQIKKKEKKSILKWEPTFVDIAKSGDLGYTYGNYELTVFDLKGNKKVKYGYYITVWKKQADGTWKFVFDAGNESPPLKKKVQE
jgi:ketosteroid isomerase-like protein